MTTTTTPDTSTSTGLGGDVDPAPRILVTGSRTWDDVATIRDALAPWWTHTHGRALLVSGACPRGADRIAETLWTRWRGRVQRYPADWHRHGRSAGIHRNTTMVGDGATVCLAFIRDHSPGATHCARHAHQNNIPVHHHPYHGPTRDDDHHIDAVIRTARHPGYVLIGPAHKPFRRDTDTTPTRTDAVTAIGHAEADLVTRLLDAGHLRLGERCRVTYGPRSGPATTVTVPAIRPVGANPTSALTLPDEGTP